MGVPDRPRVCTRRLPHTAAQGGRLERGCPGPSAKGASSQFSTTVGSPVPTQNQTSHTSRGTDSSPPRRRQVFEAAASTGGDGARAATSAAPRTPGTPSSRAARWPPPAAAPPLRTTRGEGSDSTQPVRGRRKEGARARCGAGGEWHGAAIASVRSYVSQAIGPSSRLRRLQLSPRPRAPADGAATMMLWQRSHLQYHLTSQLR